MKWSFVARGRAAMIGAILFACATAASAQTVIGPRAAPAPTYGAPAAINLPDYQATLFSSSGFNFQLVVDLAELQSILPEGYTAVASQTDPATASLTAIFATQNIMTLRTNVGGFAPGAYGPFDSFDLVAGAIPPGGTRPESVVIARFVNNVEIADLRNALYGSGTTRFADIDIHTRLELGQRTMTGRIVDETLGFRIRATETGLDQINSTIRNLVFPLLVRTTDFSQLPLQAGIATDSTLSGDQSTAAANPLTLEVGAARIRFGSRQKLEVLQAAPGTFLYNQERHHKNR